MCTGFHKTTQQYFCKPCPARKGDFIEFIAEMNLLVALSCCPQGDVSITVGQEVPESICHPLKIEVFRSWVSFFPKLAPKIYSQLFSIWISINTQSWWLNLQHKRKIKALFDFGGFRFEFMIMVTPYLDLTFFRKIFKIIRVWKIWITIIR